MFRVLIADPIEAEGVALLQAAGLEVVQRRGLSEAELLLELPAFDALLVRSKTVVTARALEATRRLRIVTRAGIGVDNVDLAAASRRGVIVTNVPDASTTTTAEHAIALLLSLARRIPAADRHLRAGGFERAKFVGSEICGKTLGVIGLGRIGKVVADRALGLKMRVVAHDPFLPAGAAGMAGVTCVPLPELMAQVHALTVHVPLTDATRGMIGAAQFAQAKRGLLVVNAARGGIVDEAALVAALESGQVAGAALDVFVEEPPPADSPLRRFEQLILTPHLGASTAEAQLRVALEAAAQIVDFARTGVARSAVNYAALPEDLREELAPCVELATRLGLLAGAACDGRMARVAVTFRGERFEAAGERATAPLRAALLAGLLQRTLGEGVSAVNAALFARDRQIEILEARAPRDRDFVLRIVVEVEFATPAGPRTLCVEGTCFGRRPRLIAFDGVPLDAPLEGVLLVTRHRDRPGQVGRIGTLLGQHGVNLTSVDVGTLPSGAQAVGVLGIGGELPTAALSELAQVEGIEETFAVRLPAAP